MNWQEVAAIVAVLGAIAMGGSWLVKIAIASAVRAEKVQHEFEKRELKTKLDFLRIEKYLTGKLANFSQRLIQVERALEKLLDFSED